MPDYWEASKKLVANPTEFLDSLLTFDRDHIPEDVIKRVDPFMALEEVCVFKMSAAERVVNCRQPRRCRATTTSRKCPPEWHGSHCELNPTLRAVHAGGGVQGVQGLHFHLHVGARNAPLPPRGARGECAQRGFGGRLLGAR